MTTYAFHPGVPQVMGILNVTPDSFSDGGQYAAPEAAIARAFDIEREGADILDIGAQSTRPGHAPVQPEEELRRLLPVLEGLQGKLHIPISIDTFYPLVAGETLQLGARIINDISGAVTNGMAEVVRQYGAGWVLMHNGGGADAAQPYADVIQDVQAALAHMAQEAMRLGVLRESLCLDPGIGFGKTQADNLRLLANMEQVKVPGFALLVGASRKRVVRHAAGEAADLTAGTIAAHTIAQWGGADILRVHDVKQARQAADMAAALLENKNPATTGFS